MGCVPGTISPWHSGVWLTGMSGGVRRGCSVKKGAEMPIKVTSKNEENLGLTKTGEVKAADGGAGCGPRSLSPALSVSVCKPRMFAAAAQGGHHHP